MLDIKFFFIIFTNVALESNFSMLQIFIFWFLFFFFVFFFVGVGVGVGR